MEIETHPISQLLELKSRGLIPNAALFNFSLYKYSFKDQVHLRRPFKVLASEMTEIWLTNQLEQLKEGWELSFHSMINFPNRQIFHVPLVDFHFEEFSDEVKEALEYRISRQGEFVKYLEMLREMSIYSSGKSFHGYGNRLLTKSKWREFTVLMLLLNYTRTQSTTNVLVDTRWIAHRLLANYTCLRWSKNTEKSIKYPAFYRNGLC